MSNEYQGGYTRRQELTCTEAEIATYADLVLHLNEKIYVRMNSGVIRMKLGDGVTGLRDLPYTKIYDGTLEEVEAMLDTRLMDISGVLVSPEEPTNPDVSVWIDPDEEGGENFLTEADIAQGLGDRPDMVLSQKAVTREIKSKNVLDPYANGVTKYCTILGDGTLFPSRFTSVSDFIPIKPLDGLRRLVNGISGWEVDGALTYAYYDINKNLLGVERTWGEDVLHVPYNDNTAYVRIPFNGDTVITINEELPTNYIPFYNVESNGEKTERLHNERFNVDDYHLPKIFLQGDTSEMSKDNKVTLNVVYYDEKREGYNDGFVISGSCSVKWQGSSSLAYPKKNYTITFNQKFEAKNGWGSTDKYCLKANWIDFSHARNVCSAKLWGGVVRSRNNAGDITMLPNCGAIDGFPCMVIINGEYQGLYSFTIPKDGFLLGMGGGEKEAIVCAEGVGSGCIFKGNAVLGESFDLEYHSDTFSETEITNSLNTLINACINSDGTDIDTVIANYLDIDSAIDYYIFSVPIGHNDGISKNYLLYTYNGVKWYFGAYDMDGVFGLYWDGKRFVPAYATTNYPAGCFLQAANLHKLFELLYTHKKTLIKERFNALVNPVNWWDGAPMCEIEVENVFNNYVCNIPKALFDEEVKLWGDIPSTSVSNIEQINSWYKTRLAAVKREVETF